MRSRRRTSGGPDVPSRARCWRSAGTVQGIHDGIFAIGRALGRETEAAGLVNTIKTPHRTPFMTRSNTVVPPTVVVLEWTDPVFAMGNWGPELVEAANGRLLLGEKGEYSAAIDWQQCATPIRNG